ncbi:MAG: hypothetical protein ACRD0A_07340 [Acidimicrobiales bacterium]
MFTTGAKWFFGVTIYGLLAAMVYGLGTGSGLMGVITLGIKGGAGELAGLTVLVSLSGAAALIGAVVLAYRDADAAEIRAALDTETLPAAGPPATPSFWPVIAAFGAALVVLGLVVGAGLVAVGLFVVGAALVEWMVQAWADRATGDPEANRQIRNRIMYPLEIPIGAAAAVGAVVFLLSRVLLALPQSGSTTIAIAVAAVLLVVCFLVAARPRITKGLVAGLIVVGAVAVLVGGVFAVASGEREFEIHEEEPEEGRWDRGAPL